jgi:hypothetical protein
LAGCETNKHARDGQNVTDEVEFGVGGVFNGRVRRPFETTVILMEPGGDPGSGEEAIGAL